MKRAAILLLLLAFSLPASAQLKVQIQDEGVPKGTFTKWLPLNFTGAGITCETVDGVVECEVTAASATAPFTTSTANPASTGVLRCANNEYCFAWRNAANSANLGCKLNTSNLIECDAGFSISGTPALSGAPGAEVLSGAGEGKLQFSSTGNRPRYSYDGGAFSSLVLFSDVGTGAGQVAAGDHSHTGVYASSSDLTTSESALKTGIQNSSYIYAASATGNDTYVVTLSPAPSAYATGQCFLFKPDTANTGAASLNVNSLGAKTIVKVAGGVTTTLADNDIRANQMALVCYDGTNFQLQSTLGNAAAGSGSSIGAFIGASYNTTVNASTTTYALPIGGIATFNGTEANRQMAMPSACTAKNLTVLILTAQPGTGSLTVKLRDGAADTGLVVTINASATAGAYRDTSNTASVTTSSLLSFQLVNAASGSSANILHISFQCD